MLHQATQLLTGEIHGDQLVGNGKVLITAPMLTAPAGISLRIPPELVNANCVSLPAATSKHQPQDCPTKKIAVSTRQFNRRFATVCCTSYRFIPAVDDLFRLRIWLPLIGIKVFSSKCFTVN
jgi:hypothetical protein